MQIRSSYMDRESGKRHGCVGNEIKKNQNKKREKQEEKKEKRIRVKSHFRGRSALSRRSGSRARKTLGLPRCVVATWLLKWCKYLRPFYNSYNAHGHCVFV